MTPEKRTYGSNQTFECVRPQAEKAERVAALPYDVYNREEACREVAREPLSF